MAYAAARTVAVGDRDTGREFGPLLDRAGRANAEKLIDHHDRGRVAVMRLAQTAGTSS